MKLDNTIVITFCGPEHEELRKEFHSLYDKYFEKGIAYSTSWMKETEFYKENMQMFQYRKYFGYFLWKPYIIIKTLNENPNSNVLYCDSNIRFTNFVEFGKSYNELMSKQQSYFVEHQNFINRCWTKRDTFILMDSDSEYYWNSKQVWTPLMGFSKSLVIEHLLYEYLRYCKNPLIASEVENTLGANLPEFREHRWEQSIMSLLVKRFRLQGIPDTKLINWAIKEYPPEIIKMKEEINADPLAKST